MADATMRLFAVAPALSMNRRRAPVAARTWVQAVVREEIEKALLAANFTDRRVLLAALDRIRDAAGLPPDARVQHHLRPEGAA